MASKHRKHKLLTAITQSIGARGWDITHLSDPKLHPFRLKIQRDEVSHIMRIYVWKLTHGGGARRPKDEYRIQITSVEQFKEEPDGKTLILGWWNESEVFVGFDFNKHKDPLGNSPSIQIREAALKKAHVEGIAACPKNNKEIAIAFRPDYFITYVQNIEALHSSGKFEQNPSEDKP